MSKQEEKQNHEPGHTGAGDEEVANGGDVFGDIKQTLGLPNSEPVSAPATGGKKSKTSKRKNGGKNKTSKRKTGGADPLQKLMDMMQGGKQKRRAAANVIDKLIGGDDKMLNKLKSML